jgi:hypothetical protein
MKPLYANSAITGQKDRNSMAVLACGTPAGCRPIQTKKL